MYIDTCIYIYDTHITYVSCIRICINMYLPNTGSLDLSMIRSASLLLQELWDGKLKITLKSFEKKIIYDMKLKKRIELAGIYVKQNKNILDYNSCNYNNIIDKKNNNNNNNNNDTDNVHYNNKNLPIPPYVEKHEKNNFKNENYYEHIKNCLAESPFWALWKDRGTFDKYVYV
jgi:hypothetical protein